MESIRLEQPLKSNGAVGGFKVDVDKLFYVYPGTVILAFVRSSNDIRVYDFNTKSYYHISSGGSYIPMHILLTILKGSMAEVTLLGNTLKSKRRSILDKGIYSKNKDKILRLTQDIGNWVIEDSLFEEGNSLFARYSVSDMLRGLNIFCSSYLTSLEELGLDIRWYTLGEV